VRNSAPSKGISFGSTTRMTPKGVPIVPLKWNLSEYKRYSLKTSPSYILKGFCWIRKVKWDS